MHIQAYFSIFTLVMPSIASKANIQTAAGAQRERCFFRLLILPIKVVASDVRRIGSRAITVRSRHHAGCRSVVSSAWPGPAVRGGQVATVHRQRRSARRIGVSGCRTPRRPHRQAPGAELGPLSDRRRPALLPAPRKRDLKATGLGPRLTPRAGAAPSGLYLPNRSSASLL